jgi:hypothetical protein
MGIQKVFLTNLVSSANLNGTYTAVDEDPDSPDGNWMDWDGAGNITAHYSVGTPSQSPETGAGLQEFRFWVRKNASGGNQTDYTVDLYENGVEITAAIATGTITNTTGEIISATWDAADLGTADGSLVEIFITHTGGTGSPAARRGIDIGAVIWNAGLPNSAISGTIAVAFDSNADLADAPGADLDGTISVAFGETGALVGQGELSASEAITFDDNATLTPPGDVDGTIAIVFDKTADLKGRAEMSATEAISFSETANLKGGGALSAIEAVTFGGAANLDLRIPFNIVASSNIAASGENTTDRLTGGGTHGGGRVQDDENPGDFVNLAENESREDAWVIQPDSVFAIQGLQYSFRLVLADDTELDTYTAIPKWTIAEDGAISGTITVTFGDSVTLTGIGDLASTTAAAFTLTGSMASTGVLAGTTALAFTETATLAASGALAGTTAAAFTETGSITGFGALAASENVLFGDNVTLTGIGVLGGAGSIVFGDIASLAAQGILEGTGAILFAETANLAASGALAGTTAAAFGDTATLTGKGALAGTTEILFDSVANLLDAGGGD